MRKKCDTFDENVKLLNQNVILKVKKLLTRKIVILMMEIVILMKILIYPWPTGPLKENVVFFFICQINN